MLDVKGFRGVRFDAQRAGNLDHIVTPPYDVISEPERVALAALSPYNYTHAMLPQEQEGRDRYSVARSLVNAWRADGILAQDAAPSIYLYRQRFVDVYGRELVRRGFFAAVKLPEAGERTILGHERTFPKHVQDRLRLTEAAEANLEPVFSLYADPQGTLAPLLAQMDQRPPDGVALTTDDVRQEYWRVEGDAEVRAFFHGKTLYIADGHHRFLTACMYRDALRAANPGVGEAPYDYVLMGLVALDDPGLQIYPTHRLAQIPSGFDVATFLQQLEQWFVVQPVGEGLSKRLELSGAACAIGLAVHGAGEFLLELKHIDRVDFLGDDRGPAWRDLDVAVLHRGILECTLRIPEGTQFGYEKDFNAALAAVHRGDYPLAFLLRPPTTGQVRACADAAEPMPQKSTYFFPKLASGLVFYSFV